MNAGVPKQVTLCALRILSPFVFMAGMEDARVLSGHSDATLSGSSE